MYGPTPSVSWSQFVDQFWEKRPTVLHTGGQPLVGTDIVFQAMRAGFDAWQSGRERMFSFYIDGALVQDYTPYLPSSEDTSLEAYVYRLTGDPLERELTFTQHTMQVYSPEIYRLGRAFIRGLIDIVGIPTDGVDVDTFLGRYSSTPRGIHTDQASTFMHVLTGRKRMVLWPPEYFSGKDVTIVGSPLRKTILNYDIAEALPDGIVLEGGPGDILYWPSSYWHVAVASDPSSFSAVLNVGVFLGEQKASMVYNLVNRVVREALKDFHTVGFYPLDRRDQAALEQAPAAEVHRLDRIRKMLSSAAAEGFLRDEWLKRVSATGFRQVPPPRQRIQLTGEETVRTDPDYPLVWHVSPESITVYANGHSAKVPNDPAFLDLLDHLNGGEPSLVRTLEERFTPADGGQTVRSLLEELYSFRAIEFQ